MFYIKKQPESPAEFSNAIAGLERYEALKDDNRKKVMALLTKEQGGLCAICERRADKIGMTIEHFLPKSFFPDLQLSYSNLYACCNKCNEPKAEHLIPSYIFDPRFSPFYISKSNVRVLKPIYDFNSDAETCRVIVPEAMSMKVELNSTRPSAYIMQATLDLLVQKQK